MEEGGLCAGPADPLAYVANHLAGPHNPQHIQRPVRRRMRPDDEDVSPRPSPHGPRRRQRRNVPCPIIMIVISVFLWIGSDDVAAQESQAIAPETIAGPQLEEGS